MPTLHIIPDGLPDFGYSKQAEYIALALTMQAGSEQNRLRLIEALENLTKPTSFDDEDFDRAQALALLLSNLCRTGCGLREEA